MLRANFVAALLLSTITSASVAADYKGTTEELATFAAKWQQSIAQGAIYGGPEVAMDIAYFQGFTTGVALATLNISWCPTSAFSMTQIQAIAAKFLTANPERWNEPTQSVVKAGLAQAYPCKPVRSKK